MVNINGILLTVICLVPVIFCILFVIYYKKCSKKEGYILPETCHNITTCPKYSDPQCLEKLKNKNPTGVKYTTGFQVIDDETIPSVILGYPEAKVGECVYQVPLTVDLYNKTIESQGNCDDICKYFGYSSSGYTKIDDPFNNSISIYNKASRNDAGPEMLCGCLIDNGGSNLKP